MIDYATIQTSVIQIIRDLVGYRLSSLLDEGDNPIPAVMKPRQRDVRADYPYITVDITETNRVMSWNRDHGVDKGGLIWYEADHHLEFTIDSYGDGSQSILQELRAKLAFDSIRNRIRNETGGSLLGTEDIRQVPRLRATDFVDNAFMRLTINVRDRVTDPDGGYIDTVDIGVGNPASISYLQYGDDDPAPLEITFKVQAP